MADLDVRNDITPLLVNKPTAAPTITLMKAALTTYNSTSYSAATMRAMSERDLQYACKLHGLTVAGLL